MEFNILIIIFDVNICVCNSFPRPVLRYYGEVSTAVFNENQLKSNIAENVTGFPNTDYESPPYQAQIGL